MLSVPIPQEESKLVLGDSRIMAGDSQFGMDAVQGTQIGVLSDKLGTALKILTGNGDPASGLVVRFMEMVKTVEDLKKSTERDVADLRKEVTAQVNDIKKDMLEIKLMIERTEKDRREEIEKRRLESREFRNFLGPAIVNIISAIAGGLITLIASGHLVFK